MCAISLGPLIYSQTQRSSARRWHVTHTFVQDRGF